MGHVEFTEEDLANEFDIRDEYGRCPIAREIVKLCTGERPPESIRAARRWLKQCYHRPRDNELVMEALNDWLGGCGVEAIRVEGAHVDNYHYDIVATYVNCGDTYATTIVLDSETQTFLLTSWGDFYEGYIEEHPEIL